MPDQTQGGSGQGCISSAARSIGSWHRRRRGQAEQWVREQTARARRVRGDDEPAGQRPPVLREAGQVALHRGAHALPDRGAAPGLAGDRAQRRAGAALPRVGARRELGLDRAPRVPRPHAQAARRASASRCPAATTAPRTSTSRTTFELELPLEIGEPASSQTEQRPHESPPERLPALVAAVLLGVDVGGTFTDAVLFDGERFTRRRSPTTPADQSAGVVAAVDAVLERRRSRGRRTSRPSPTG